MTRRRALATAAVSAAIGASAFSLAAGAVPLRDAAPHGVLYVIGDSWSAGLHADPEHTLVQDAAEDLGMGSVADAESGTGYLTAPSGTETYARRAATIPPGTRAEIVVVQGGSNDTGADLMALPGAVRRTVAAVRHAVPGAPVVLLGPGPDPWPVTAKQHAVDAVLQRTASTVGADYISPLQEGWFTASTVHAILDPGNAHPTPAGHEVLGARLAHDLRPLLGTSDPAAGAAE